MNTHETLGKISAAGDSLFERVVSILEQARASVVRSVNTNMVLAYWLIGREIVLELQGGEERAEYGKQVIQELSSGLTKKYGGGFSVTNLQYFRKFFQSYPARLGIPRPMGAESPRTEQQAEISRPVGAESMHGFSPQLSWSHYRALMRVSKPEAQEFYEREAIACGWDKRSLERHIHSQYFERLLKSQHPQKMLEAARKDAGSRETAIATLKNPYVLEFLGLPQLSALQESQLESAIITHLQAFLLELGKGFAFVARQKRLRFNDTDLYVDLVFYNCILKCYLLIDLKMGELSYKDVGQMDGYVRMFDDLYIAQDDNPTIGLILCTEKNEAVARYSVLNERRQIFASKYMLYLPTEEELARELARERMLIEAQLEERRSIAEAEESDNAR
ncbi:MAG: hypothetical protein A2511_11455 [Deltaproteobacteria bacterium RIFOXYD12_FULL_50_9]|nr:MAG: hypothetical protein A2511_11455 [Deltaproteobacteria bacterium RIFOXYD12_FULL_50_9]